MAVTERFITHRADPSAEQRRGMPPGPKLPIAGQTLLFMLAKTWAGPRWQRRYGDVISMRIAPAGDAVLLCRPDHIREVFAGPADTFHAGEGNAILGPIMGQHSVLLLDEQAHLAARKRVMSAFHGAALKTWAARIEQITADSVARWPRGKAAPVHPELNDISLEVILQIVFGVTDERRLTTMRPMLKKLVQIGPVVFMGWLYPQLMRFGPWKRFDKLKRATDDQIYALIADRRVAADLADRTDVLSRLLVAAPEQSDEELRDHLVTLLLAGHETTASTLAWTLHDLARNPAMLARAQRAAEDDDEDFLEAVVKESMRLRPVITVVARRLAKPVTVAGYDLPEGVVVFPSIHMVQRTPSVFPSPDEFRPERFLGSNPPPATWIPFGGGIRRCLGASLAMIEAVAVLKVVLRTVDLSPAGGAELPKTRNITMVPARGARLVALSR